MDRLAWKAKIGLVVVSSSTVCEGRYPRVAPADVGFFTSRMLLRGGGLAEIEAMEAHAVRAIEELASVPVDAIAYCCTVSGALRGVAADVLFISCMNFDAMPAVQALEDRLGKPVVTSHSATLWRALTLAGIDTPIPGYGRLLQRA